MLRSELAELYLRAARGRLSALRGAPRSTLRAVEARDENKRPTASWRTPGEQARPPSAAVPLLGDLPKATDGRGPPSGGYGRAGALGRP